MVKMAAQCDPETLEAASQRTTLAEDSIDRIQQLKLCITKLLANLLAEIVEKRADNLKPT